MTKIWVIPLTSKSPLQSVFMSRTEIRFAEAQPVEFRLCGRSGIEPSSALICNKVKILHFKMKFCSQPPTFRSADLKELKVTFQRWFQRGSFKLSGLSSSVAEKCGWIVGLTGHNMMQSVFKACWSHDTRYFTRKLSQPNRPPKKWRTACLASSQNLVHLLEQQLCFAGY